MKFDKRLWVNLGKTTVLSLGVLGIARGLLSAGYSVTDNENWHLAMQMAIGLCVLAYFYVLTNSGVGTLAKGVQMYDGVVHGLWYGANARYRRYAKLKKQRACAEKDRKSTTAECQHIEHLTAVKQANTPVALAATGVSQLIDQILTAQTFVVLGDPDECYNRALVDNIFIDLDSNTVCAFNERARSVIKVTIPAHQSLSIRDAILRRCVSQTNLGNRYAQAAALVSESPDLTIMDAISGKQPPVGMPGNMFRKSDKTR